MYLKLGPKGIEIIPMAHAQLCHEVIGLRHWVYCTPYMFEMFSKFPWGRFFVKHAVKILLYDV